MIKDLINAIAEGDTLEIDRTFNSVMAHKISERLDSMRVDVAQSMFSGQMVEEGVASGEWHVTDELKGGIHSTHSSARKAKNMAEKLNAADYEQNKDDPSRTSGKLFHNRYAIQAASEPLSIWNKAAQKRQQNESIEDYSIGELEEFMMSEEFDALDEVSKATLGSYIKSASSPDHPSSVTSAAARATHFLGAGKIEQGLKDVSLQQKRAKGISKAVDKLVKKDIEEGYSKYSPRSYHMTKKIEPFYSHSIDKDGNHVFRNSGDVTTINPNDTDALTNYAKRISMDMNTQGGHLGSSSIGMTYGSGDQQKDVDAILAKLRK